MQEIEEKSKSLVIFETLEDLAHSRNSQSFCATHVWAAEAGFPGIFASFCTAESPERTTSCENCGAINRSWKSVRKLYSLSLLVCDNEGLTKVWMPELTPSPCTAHEEHSRLNSRRTNVRNVITFLAMVQTCETAPHLSH